MTHPPENSGSRTSVLHADRLYFGYDNRLVFSGWSHDFKPGITWVQGRNGDGKSTLLKMLGGVLTPRTGELAIGSLSARSAPLPYRRAVFWCGPGAMPFDHLSVNEYFGFMGTLYPTFDDDSALRHAAGFHLSPFLSSSLKALSTGTQRKVWLCAALSAGTAVILLDEPLSALDADATTYLLAELERSARNENRATIIASHEDLGAAGLLAEKVFLQALSRIDTVRSD